MSLYQVCVGDLDSWFFHQPLKDATKAIKTAIKLAHKYSPQVYVVCVNTKTLQRKVMKVNWS